MLEEDLKRRDAGVKAGLSDGSRALSRTRTAIEATEEETERLVPRVGRVL